MLARCDKASLRWLTKATTASYPSTRFKSDSQEEQKKSENVDPKSYFYPNTEFGIKERSIKPDKSTADKPLLTPFPPFPDGKNPKTGEIGGPTGPEPTQYGDWQRKGRVTDF